MDEWTPTRVDRRHYLLACLLIGLVLLGGVLFFSVRADLEAEEARFAETIGYVKEQCTNYDNLNLAAKAKSLMRVIENAQHLRENMAMDLEMDPGLVLDDAAMENYLRSYTLSGILLLTPEGKAACGASVDELTNNPLTAEELPETLSRTALLGVADHPEQVYATRLEMQDGSYLDIASCARADKAGVLVVYYHTSEEYVRNYSLSYQNIVQGYGVDANGTLAVTRGDVIVASNDESLLGTSVEDTPALAGLKEQGVDGEMIHVHSAENGRGCVYGVIERGRNFYVYMFRPEGEVFRSTPRNMMLAALAYVLIIFLVQTLRWKTAQRYKEEQLRREQEYQKTLKAEALKAEAANIAKTEFLQRMSHDIRTPINGIRGMVEIANRCPDDPARQADCRKKIWEASSLLLELVNEVLDMGKLESGEVVLERVPFDLPELLYEIRDVLEKTAVERGITLYCEPLDLPHERLIGSPLHVKRLLMNILSNAIKYNKEKGRVMLNVYQTHEENDRVWVRFICADTGIGMSKEFQKRMYEPFTQENSGARSTYGGTGLGMAITKSLVDKMGGTIEVESQQGVGTTYTITLPFEIDHSPDAKPAAKQDVDLSVLKGTNVLLAEDNALNMEIAEFLLNEVGVQVTKVTNGKQAVDAFASSPVGGFDAILMDVMMPVLDGHDATRAIRAMERPDAKTIPILAMTANAFVEDRQKALEAGMTDHLTKPLDPDTLYRLLAKAVEEKAQQ